MTKVAYTSGDGAVLKPATKASALAAILDLLESRLRKAPEELGGLSADGSLLAWLAKEGGSATRRAVAANRGTPVEVDLVLLDDKETDVRAELAHKLSWRLSRTDDTAAPSPRKSILAGIERLARDPDPAVRAVLAYEIRYLCEIPAAVVHTLAADPDAAVSGPILACSPLLNENDLVAIARTCETPEKMAAIARRRPLSSDFCDAFVMLAEPGMIALLVANPDAAIRKETIEHIAQHPEAAAWCLDALSMRTDLSPKSVQAIARLASQRTIERLVTRARDEETRTILYHELRSRQDSSRAASAESLEDATLRAQKANEQGCLDDAFVKRAADLREVDVVVAALAVRTSLSRGVVRRALFSGSSTTVAALVRRAGFNARSAYRILEMTAAMPRPVLPRPPQKSRPVSRWRAGIAAFSLASSR